MDENKTEINKYHIFGGLLLFGLALSSNDFSGSSYIEWTWVAQVIFLVTFMFIAVTIYQEICTTDEKEKDAKIYIRYKFAPIILTVIAIYVLIRIYSFLNIRDYVNTVIVSKCSESESSLSDKEDCMYGRGIRDFELFQDTEDWENMHDMHVEQRAEYDSDY